MAIEHGCRGSSDGYAALSLDGEGIEDGNFFLIVVVIVAVVDGMIFHLVG